MLTPLIRSVSMLLRLHSKNLCFLEAKQTLENDAPSISVEIFTLRFGLFSWNYSLQNKLANHLFSDQITC